MATADIEFPPDVSPYYRKARRFAWITLAYVGSAVVFLYLTMGESQAMRSSFFEDLTSLTPALVFLICAPIARRPPSGTYPYGLHRATSFGHMALCATGSFLLIEAALLTLSGEETVIKEMVLFDHVIWAGWPMLAAIAYTGIPSFFLGRVKMRLAPHLHDKILQADAKMMKADWLAESPTAIGVIGTGLGVMPLEQLPGEEKQRPAMAADMAARDHPC